MECTPKVDFGFMGSLVFAGWFFASFFVPRLADLYGRRPIFIINLLVQACVIGLLILSKSQTLTTICLFVMGMCAAGRWTIGYVYLSEFLAQRNVLIVAPVVNASAALAIVASTVTFQFITTYTVYFEVFTLVLNIVLVVLIFFFIPETPKWLISNNQDEEARKSL